MSNISEINGLNITAATASFVPASAISGTVTSASYAATASLLLGSVTSASYAATASLLLGSVTSASYAATASYVNGNIFTNSNSATSASYAATASYVNTLNQNVIVSGSIDINNGGKLTVNAVGGDEGGEILFGKAITNTTLTGSGVTVDVYQNKLRIFEQGGNTRGGYYDITTLSNSVATNLSPIRNIQSTADGTAVTGTTASTLTRSILIPANTVAVGDVISIRSRIRKTGTAGTVILRYYINTSAAIGGSLVGTSTTAAATTLYNQIPRTLAVKTTTNTETFPGATTSTTDDAISTAAVSSNNIDWTVDQYFVVAVQNANAADSTVSSFVHIQINKS